MISAALTGGLLVSRATGGKSPNVGHADADLDWAIPGAANTIF